MGILNIDLNDNNLDDTNYEENDRDTIILIRFWIGIINLKNVKT